MPIRALTLVLAAACAMPAAADDWIEIVSPHFTVVSNARRGRAWTVADEFERIRSVYETALTLPPSESETPVLIFAVTDEASFRELAPWLGELLPAGMFAKNDEGARIVLRLDATGEGRFHTVYHEYHHLLLGDAAGERLPSWVVEGLAEFWSQAVIRGDEVELGNPDPGHLRLLRDQRLMPLSELLAVYGFSHDAPRRAIQTLYAQSWALTHWILLGDGTGRGQAKMDAYVALLADGADSIEAFESTFGELEEVEDGLRAYLRQTMFSAMRVPAPAWIEDEFAVRALSDAESADVRADFLMWSGHTQAARRLLEGDVAGEVASGGRAEQLGILAFEDADLDDARLKLDEAIDTDTASHLSYYYRARIAREQGDEASAIQDLERAVELTPSHGPSYVELATALALDPGRRERALQILSVAVELAPDDRLQLAQLGRALLAVGQIEQAETILERMRMLPASPGSKAIDRALEQAIRREAAR